MKTALRIAKNFFLMFALLGTACSVSPQAAPSSASLPQPYPMPSTAPCDAWPEGTHLRLTPENGRYLITLDGLPPNAPFTLRYSLQRGDFSDEQAFDALAGADGTYHTYSVNLPPSVTPVSAYPAPGAVLGGEALIWHFTLQQGSRAYCMDISMLP